MELLGRVEGFEWDEANIDKNLEKHRVAYYEAEEVFYNDPLIVTEDIRHSRHEKRYYALGKTNRSRFLFLVFTVRKNKIRIISVRNMNKKERRLYK